MAVILSLNGIDLKFSVPEAGDKIIALTKGQLAPEKMADWLYAQTDLTQDDESLT